ncbi:MAG: ABC transporter ATP-binding protein, partial [Rhodococcus sp. (in: high G+C Gram-positive bacteria)]
MTSPQDPTWGSPNSQYFDDSPTVVFAKIPSEPESADGDAKSSNPENPDKEPKPALTATDTKPRHFKATMKRLLSLLQPHKFAVVCVVVATIASIALSVAVPKILGHATDLIFAGFIGKSLPAGLTRDQAAEAIRASGNSTFADLVANSTDVVPGVGLN